MIKKNFPVVRVGCTKGEDKPAMNNRDLQSGHVPPKRGCVLQRSINALKGDLPEGAQNDLASQAAI